MQITGFDHIVMSVRDVGAIVAFYRDILGMQAREERPGKWSLHFGPHKISLQDEAAKPALARGTVPGAGNFCVMSAMPVEEVAAVLRAAGVDVLAGPRVLDGAQGPIRSIHFRDPEGNLVEIANPA